MRPRTPNPRRCLQSHRVCLRFQPVVLRSSPSAALGVACRVRLQATGSEPGSGDREEMSRIDGMESWFRACSVREDLLHPCRTSIWCRHCTDPCMPYRSACTCHATEGGLQLALRSASGGYTARGCHLPDVARGSPCGGFHKYHQHPSYP